METKGTINTHEVVHCMFQNTTPVRLHRSHHQSLINRSYFNISSASLHPLSPRDGRSCHQCVCLWCVTCMLFEHRSFCECSSEGEAAVRPYVVPEDSDSSCQTRDDRSPVSSGAGVDIKPCRDAGETSLMLFYLKSRGMTRRSSQTLRLHG